MINIDPKENKTNPPLLKLGNPNVSELNALITPNINNTIPPIMLIPKTIPRYLKHLFEEYARLILLIDSRNSS